MNEYLLEMTSELSNKEYFEEMAFIRQCHKIAMRNNSNLDYDMDSVIYDAKEYQQIA